MPAHTCRKLLFFTLIKNTLFNYSFGFFQEEPKPTLLELAQKVPEQLKNATMHDIVVRHIEVERERSSFQWIVTKMRQQTSDRYGEERSDREECDR